MRTLVWDGPDAMHVEEAPEPSDPGPGELILRPEAVGICGSEVEGYLGHMGNRSPPLVMGHEFAGTVVATGEGASELDGARVAVNPLSGCGECRLCRSGFSNLCKDRVLVGTRATRVRAACDRTGSCEHSQHGLGRHRRSAFGRRLGAGGVDHISERAPRRAKVGESRYHQTKEACGFYLPGHVADVSVGGNFRVRVLEPGADRSVDQVLERCR